MEFYTQWERPKGPKGEPGGRKSRVEVAAYMPAKQRIENMILAGERLIAARKEAFDFPDGKIDDSYIDKTRDGNYDLADASEDLQKLQQKKRMAAIHAQRVKERAAMDKVKAPPAAADGDGK